MNSASKRQYDSAHRQLKNGQSASYTQLSGGSRINGEWVDGTPTSTPITCYQNAPSTEDVQKGLSAVTDVKVLVSAKAMPTVLPKSGDVIVLSEYSLTVKAIDPIKSLEGVTVLWQLFSSKMS